MFAKTSLMTHNLQNFHIRFYISTWKLRADNFEQYIHK